MMLFSHPLGNNNAREAAKALEYAGLLKELHLSIAVCGNNLFSHLARLPGLGEFQRRTYDARLRPYLRLHPFRESGRLLASRMGRTVLTRHEFGYFSVDGVYQNFDRIVSRQLGKTSNLLGVYCYEDGALETFREAKRRGITCIYDLPIAYWKTARTLLQEEAVRYPEWEPTLVGTRDSAEKCARKDEELELADAVICPSQFVSDSLPALAMEAKPVYVIPFGSPVLKNLTQKRRDAKGHNGEKLKILFAGSMSQRKGLADLFAAMKLLDPAKFELHVLGAPIAGLEFYKAQYSYFIHHAPRSHERVLELMCSCDVFVLPSIVEGRALVQQEALACGLPIIVTKNAGAEDLVEDGRAGRLVPIRNPEAIAAGLEELESDRSLLELMRRAAITKADEVSWEAYRKSITKAVQSTLTR